LSGIVIDASALGPILFEDEPDRIAELDARFEHSDLVVPSNWSREVTSMILIAERRQRIDARERTRLISLAAAIPADPDPDSFRQGWKAASALAIAHGLTVYDAAYLELASRRGLPLATLDRDLAAAAQREGIEVFTVS